MDKMDIQQQHQQRQQPQPRISFSANGSGVSLQFTLIAQPSYSHLPTKQIIPFSTQEYSFYETLFKAIDINNDGLLLLPQNKQALSLLLRTQLTWQNDILPAISMVTQELLPVSLQHPQTPSIPESSSGSPVYILPLPQWLLLCKLLSIFKQQKETHSTSNNVKTILWQCMSIMTLSSVSLSFSLSDLSMWKQEEKEDKNIHDLQRPNALGEVCYQVYRPEVVSWKMYGDDSLKTQHVKYNIVTDIDTFVSSSLLLSQYQSNNDNKDNSDIINMNNNTSESSEAKDNHLNAISTSTTNSNNNNNNNTTNKKKKNKKPSISSVSSSTTEPESNTNKTIDSFMTVISSESSHSFSQTHPFLTNNTTSSMNNNNSDDNNSTHLSNNVLRLPTQRVLIERRYSDFVSLVSQLRHLCPGVLLPPLPKKEDLLQNLTNNPQFYYFYNNNASNNSNNSNSNAMVSSSPPASSFLSSLAPHTNNNSNNSNNNSDSNSNINGNTTNNNINNNAINANNPNTAIPSGTAINSVANRRQLELQLFFNALLFQHPQLSQVFAVQVFLSASPPALKAFFDLNWNILESTNNTKLINNANNNNNIANNNAKTITFINNTHFLAEYYPEFQNLATPQSVWGFTQMLGKAVSSLTEAVVKQVVPLVSYFSGKEPNIYEYYGLHNSSTSNSTSDSSNSNNYALIWTEDDLKAQDALYFLKLEKLGKSVESVWLGETLAMEEMTKLADVFKQMSDTEQSPSVAKLLLTFYRGLFTHATQSLTLCHTPMYIYVTVPMVYMGYYRDSFRICGVQPLQEKEKYWKQLYKDTVSCQEQVEEKQRLINLQNSNDNNNNNKELEDLEEAKRHLQDKENELQNTGKEFVHMFHGLAEDTVRLKQQQRVAMLAHLKYLAELRLEEVRRSRSHWEDVKWQLLQQQQQQHQPLFA